MINDNLKVLNHNVMLDLIGDDQELIKKFQIEFLQQAKKSIAKLSASYTSASYKEIKEEAHFLKTSAKAVGAEQSADLLQQLEDNALKEDKETCKTLIILINQSVKQVYGAIKNES